MDIYCIGAVGFTRSVKQTDSVTFITSLYKIDRVIEEKEIEAIKAESAEEELSNEELITHQLPAQYLDFRDVFSKADSDLLAPHRSYDLKINLEEGKSKEQSLGFSLLYQYSTEELRACKQYLVDNLSKGFITDSQAPFAAPILFIYKANSGLCFCIDYCKLNTIT